MMRKVSLYTLVLFSIFLIFPVMAQAEGSSLTLTSNRHNLSLGEEFSVEIVGENIADIAGVDLMLEYDGEKLSFLSKEFIFSQEKYFDLQELSDQMKDEDEKIRIVFALKKGTELLTGEKLVIAKITFRTKEEGIAEIRLSNQSKLVTELGTNYVYAMPTISSESTKINIVRKGQISGNVQLSDQADFHTTISLLQNEQVIETVLADEKGDFVIGGIEDGEYRVRIHQLGYKDVEEIIIIENGNYVTLNYVLQRIKEDVNRDGVISLEDLVAIASRYELTIHSEDWLEDADLNKDGIIDLLDILFVGRKLE